MNYGDNATGAIGANRRLRCIGLREANGARAMEQAAVVFIVVAVVVVAILRALNAKLVGEDHEEPKRWRRRRHCMFRF